LQERALDIAMPHGPGWQFRSLLVMVRRSASSGLGAVLRIDETYEIAEQDVRSKPFQMEFRNERNQLAPEVLTMRVESNDFNVPCAGKQISTRGRLRYMHIPRDGKASWQAANERG
jgi:hypothetical protein